MKKLIPLIAFVLLGLSCKKNDEAAPVNVLAIVPEKVTLQSGEYVNLQLLYNGAELSAGLAQWASSDERVAYVSAGLVLAKANGTTVVTAIYNNITAQCNVVIGSEEQLSPTENFTKSVKYLTRSAKRGVGFNFAQFPQEDVAALSPFVSWCYNWGSQPASAQISNLLDASNVDFIPMAWNGVNEAQIRAYKQTHPHCEYILAFNEPNLNDQANMTPAQAAAKWPELKNIADELGLKIVSPAMNYGTLEGYHDPVKWLDEFFQLVPITDVCAIALHCYMPAASSMYSYIHRFDKYNLPIWMTEFCSWDSPNPLNVNAQIDYMNEAVLMLEAEPKVERYAWFIPRASGAVESYPYMQLLSKTNIGQLSPQGEVFAAITTLDNNTWLPTDAPILCNTFSNCSAAESIRNGTFAAAPHLRPSTDNPSMLMLTNMAAGQWIEYQIDVKEQTTTMSFRHLGITKSALTISVDGEQKIVTDIEWSDMKWTTKDIDLTLNAGHHTLRLCVPTGHIYFGWFKLQ
ncbi:MAG TPA: hypothetical protein DEO38_02710 [Bacteroidales bacterium]|nr:hypothetical protein [Bacteroidales bacterium]